MVEYNERHIQRAGQVCQRERGYIRAARGNWTRTQRRRILRYEVVLLMCEMEEEIYGQM